MDNSFNYKIYGIYCDGNLCYVGSTRFSLEKRFLAHCIDKRRTMGQVIQKIGRDHFTIKEICSLLGNRKKAYHIEACITRCRENLGVRLYNKNYGSELPQSRKDLLSLQNKGYHHTDEAKNKISRTHKGKKHSEEWKRKIAKTHIGMKHSTETKLKLSLLKKGKSHPGKPIFCEELNVVFPKISDAAIYFGKSISAISAAVRKTNRAIGNCFHLRYATESDFSNCGVLVKK